MNTGVLHRHAWVILAAGGLRPGFASCSLRLPTKRHQVARTAGHRSAASVAQMRAASRRPAAAVILKPRIAAYHQWPMRAWSSRITPDGLRVAAQAGELETPEAGPLATARDQGLAFSFRKWAHPYRAASGAAPSPREADGLQLASS